MNQDGHAGNEQTTRESIFEFLLNYKRDHDGNPPSLREIAEACMVSVSTANYHLTRLEAENRIYIGEQPRRMIEVEGGKWSFGDETDSAAGAAQEDVDSSASTQHDRNPAAWRKTRQP